MAQMRTHIIRAGASKPKAKRKVRRHTSRTTTKTADDKGRIALGARFANRTVIVEDINESEVVIKLARVIPEREAWLFKNPTALKAVRDGIRQIRAGEVTKGPDVDADASFAAQLED